MQDIKPGAKSVHRSPQKSNTLNRQYTKKPVKNSDKKVSINQASKKTQLRTAEAQNIKKNPAVSRFAKKPLLNTSANKIEPLKNTTKKKPQQTKKESDNRIKNSPKNNASSTSQKNTKEQAIAQALNSAPQRTTKKTKRTIKSKTKRRLVISSVLLALLLVIIGGLVFFSLPSLSLHLANNQAGINARYPQASPDGYKRSGNASFVNGSVIIPFVSDDKTLTFAISQTKTIWDATKLKSEVKKLSHDNFITTEYKGLTIFHYSLGSQYITTWLNNDILYVISGNANLDPSQIRSVVDSLH